MPNKSTAAMEMELNALIEQPDRFEDCLNLLMSLNTRADAGPLSATDLSGYIAAVEKGSLDMVRGSLTPLPALIQGYEQPCFVLRPDGRILANNIAADAALGGVSGTNIDDIGLVASDASPIAPQVVGVLNTSGSNDQQKFIKVHLQGNDQLLTMVILPIDLGKGDGPHVLAFLVDVFGSPELRNYLYQEHDLTNSEQEILEKFVSGENLADISASRGRSITTVRKQFYKVAEKLGVSSQVELLREALLTSTLLTNAQPILKKAQHPHRSEVKVLRPRGRVVDVTLAGDMSGSPVVVVNSLLLRCFPAAIEKMFKDAGLLVISIAAPCFGETTPPLVQADQLKCHATDVAAVLDQLSIDKAVFFATDYRFAGSILISEQIGDRMAAIVSANIMLPESYQIDEISGFSAFQVTQKLIKSSHLMRALVARLGVRALSLFGPQVILPLIFRTSPQTLDCYRRPEVLAEVDAAFKSVFAQGLMPSTLAFEHVNSDWAPFVARCQTPVLLYRGTRSDLHQPETLQKFATDHCDVIRTIEIEGCLDTVVYGQPELLINMMQSGFDTDLVSRTTPAIDALPPKSMTFG